MNALGVSARQSIPFRSSPRVAGRWRDTAPTLGRGHGNAHLINERILTIANLDELDRGLATRLAPAIALRILDFGGQ